MTEVDAGRSRAPAVDCRAPDSHASHRVLALVLVLVALSAAVRLVDLGRFPGVVFDEHYYVHDARVILGGGLQGSPSEPWRPASLRSVAHPDLGKLAIAAGIRILGDGPWGWRVPSALAGTALVALVFPLARRMGLAADWSLAALVLAATDPMLIIESRLGVLDIFVALGTAAAVYLALGYVQSGFKPVWILVCGVAVGAAAACKWSGLLALLAVFIVVVPVLVRRSHPRLVWPVFLTGVTAVPMLVYAASSAAYFAAGHGVSDWLRLQWHMAGFGWRVHGDVSFASAPMTWPLDVHPIWYKWAATSDGIVGLLAVGNPLLWWSASAACVALAVMAVMRRDWRLGLAPAMVAALYLPWLLTTRETYIYYMAPVVPFMAVVLATALARIAGASWAFPGVGIWSGMPEEPSRPGGRRQVAAWIACLVCAGAGLLFLPFVLGVPVPFEYYDRLMLFTVWK